MVRELEEGVLLHGFILAWIDKICKVNTRVDHFETIVAALVHAP